MLTDISQFKVWYVLYIWIRWCHLINNNAINACTFLQPQYISVPIARSIYHDTTYGTVITVAESESDFRITTDTPYLALTGMLWGVNCESLEKIDRLSRHCALCGFRLAREWIIQIMLILIASNYVVPNIWWMKSVQRFVCKERIVHLVKQILCCRPMNKWIPTNVQ